MTTDNKTLADVQPGGRVRLGDEAERARFEEWLATQHDQGSEHVMATVSDTDDRYQSPVTSSMWSAWQAANAAREGGRINGWRVVDGVRVYSAYAHASILDDQQYVRYEDYLAALSAQPSPATCKEGLQVQPSPAGQDARRNAAYDAIDRFLRANMDDIAYAVHEEHLETLFVAARQQVVESDTVVSGGALRMALNVLRRAGKNEVADELESTAVRQPVGNYEIQTENGPLKCSLAVYAEWKKNEEYIARLEEELKSARQPLGEPVAWLIERLRGKGYGRDKYVVMKGQASSDPDSHLFWTDQQARDNHRVTTLYAAPPAQAVDLGQFRPAVECWRWTKAIAVNSGELDTEMKRSALFEVNEADRLLALIDSQAVGK
ncbi:hypothetical protein ACSMEB_08265 [Stenotrophomonas maltophilia]